MPIIRIRIDAHGSNPTEAFECLDVAASVIAEGLPYSLQIGDRVLEENGEEPDDSKHRWKARGTVSFDVASPLQPDGGVFGVPGAAPLERYGVDTYAWENTATPKAGYTFGVYDRSRQGRDGHLIVGGLPLEGANALSAELNRPVSELRQIAYDRVAGPLWESIGQPPQTEPRDWDGPGKLGDAPTIRAEYVVSDEPAPPTAQ